jgi:hypothetical protein
MHTWMCSARQLRWGGAANGAEQGLDVDRFGQVSGGTGGEQAFELRGVASALRTTTGIAALPT